MCISTPLVLSVAKEHGNIFICENNMLLYYEFENGSLVRKSLPFISVFNKKEAEHLISKVGDDCSKNLMDRAVVFYDPDLVKYVKVTAPLCAYEGGNYQYKDKFITAEVPSKEMLIAAENLYSIVIGPLTLELFQIRRNEFVLEFAKNSLDGKCAVMKTSLKRTQIPDDYRVLVSNNKHYFPTYFVIKKNQIPEGKGRISLNINAKDAGFIIGIHGANIKKMSIMIGHDITLLKK